MIKALMVDVDGVLVRGRPSDGGNWSAELERDLGVSLAAIDQAFFRPHWPDVVVGRAGLAERLAPALAEVAPQLGAETFISYWFAQDSRLDRPLLDALGAYRKAGLGVWLATNQEHLRARHLMAELGLAAHVDGIFYSAQLGCRKPDPAFFTGIMTQTGLAPGELLLIDDAQGNVEAALRAGWHAVHWSGTQALQDALAPFSDRLALSPALSTQAS